HSLLPRTRAPALPAEPSAFPARNGRRKRRSGLERPAIPPTFVLQSDSSRPHFDLAAHVPVSNGAHERYDARAILFPRLGFDAAANVQRVRPRALARLRRVLRRQPARQKNRAPAPHTTRHTPIECLPGSAARSFVESIQQKCARALELLKLRRAKWPAHSNRLYHRHILRHVRHQFRRFFAVQLDKIELQSSCRFNHRISSLVHEDADRGNSVVKPIHNLTGARRGNVARTFAVKVESKKISARLAGPLRVGPICNAADFYSHLYHFRNAAQCVPAAPASTVPSNSFNPTPGSACFITRSPIKNASNPADRNCSMSSRLCRPDSLTATAFSGISWTRSNEVCKLTLKSRRSRLFTPIILALAAFARASSSREWTSTSGSIPSSRPKASNSASSSLLSTATISRKESAPAALASHTCHGSTMKSLRKIGIETAFFTSFRSASEP